MKSRGPKRHLLLGCAGRKPRKQCDLKAEGGGDFKKEGKTGGYKLQKGKEQQFRTKNEALEFKT